MSRSDPFAPPQAPSIKPMAPLAAGEGPVVDYVQSTAGPKLVVGGLIATVTMLITVGWLASASASPLGVASLVVSQGLACGAAGVAIASAVAGLSAHIERPDRARVALRWELRFWQIMGLYLSLLVIWALASVL